MDKNNNVTSNTHNHNRLFLDRRVLLSYGDDCMDFLQQIFTNDIKKNVDSLTYTLILNSQGRLLHDLFVIPMTDTLKSILYLPESKAHNALLLDCHVDGIQEILEILQKYKLRSKIWFEEVKDISVSIIFDSVNIDSSIISFPDPRNKALGVRVYQQARDDNMDPNVITQQQLLQRYNDIYFQLKLPQLYRDFMPCRYFPFDLGIDAFNAISYNKGCYIGQEVVTRTHFRGIVRKHVYKMHFKNANMKTINNMLECLSNDGIIYSPDTQQKIGNIVGIYTDGKSYINGLAIINSELLKKYANDDIIVITGQRNLTAEIEHHSNT